MKKTKIITLLLLLILISCFTAVAVSAAPGGTNDPAEGMMWRITHSDGTVEYAESFNEPFDGASFRSGDKFEFLLDKYYLYHENFATIKSSVDITVDLSGSRIICPETKNDVSDIDAQMFNINLTGAATVTFLMDGTEIYVPPHARTAFSVSGNGYIVMDGGETGGKIFAPGALNLTAQPTDTSKCSYLKNVYCYKTSQNMNGLICVRKTATLKLIDSYAASENKSWTVFYLVDTGNLILNNSVAFNTAGSGVLKAGSGSPSVEVNDGSYLYGVSSFAANLSMKLRAESYYSDDISPYVGEDDVLKTDYIKQLFTLYSSSVAGDYTQKVADLTFYYVLADNMVTTDKRKFDSVWQLEKHDGSLEYTANIYTPFRYASDYKSFTLLQNLSLEKGLAAAVTGDFLFDTGSYNIFAAAGSDIVCMLSLSGSGSLTVELGKSSIVLETATLIKLEEQSAVTVNADGSYARVDALVDAKSAAVTLNGGFYELLGGDGVETDGSVILNATMLKGVGHGSLVDSKGKVSITGGTELLASLGSSAVKTENELRLADNAYIHGTVKAESIVTEGDAFFSNSPEGKTFKLLVNGTFRRSYDIPVYGKNGVETKRVTYTFAYKLTELDYGLCASLSFSSSVALNVYVPEEIVNANDSFTLRVVLDGLLYEAHAEDGAAVVKRGRNYVRFVYNYVYPSSYSATATLTLISGEYEGSYPALLSDLLLRSLDKADNEKTKATIASYIVYSMRASGLTVPADSTVMQYAVKYTRYGGSEELLKYVSNITFQPAKREIKLIFNSGLDGIFSVSYLFGEEQLKYEVNAADGEMSIPVYRLKSSSPIDIIYTSSDGEVTFSVNTFDLINSADEKSTSYEIFALYGAYLKSLYR